MDVQAIRRFGEPGREQGSAGRVLQIGHHLAILGKGNHVSVGLGGRSERARNAQHEPAQGWPLCHQVQIIALAKLAR